MMGISFGTDSTIFKALDDVQTISLMALISAAQMIEVMTKWSGCCSLKALKASGGEESAKEHPAFKSGKTTVLLGFKILAVSAIKCTPAKTMISASVSAAFCERPKLSPT